MGIRDTVPAAALSLASLVLLTGCQGGPLFQSEKDLDRRVSVARLRSINTLALE